MKVHLRIQKVQVALRVCTANELSGDGDSGTAGLWPTLGVASLEGWFSVLASRENHWGIFGVRQSNPHQLNSSF